MDTVYRRSLAKEIIVFFILVMVLIWTTTVIPKSIHWALRIALFVVFLIRWRWGGDTVIDLGLAVSPRDARQIWRGLFWITIALVGLVLLGCSVSPGFWHAPEFWDRIKRVGIGYVLLIPFQELIMHGYFTNRLDKVFPANYKKASFLVGLLFGIGHLPNVLLAAGTFVFAFGGAYFFLAHSRNLYFLCLAHLVLSHAYKHLVMFPIIGNGSMRVGPGFLD